MELGQLRFCHVCGIDSASRSWIRFWQIFGWIILMGESGSTNYSYRQVGLYKPMYQPLLLNKQNLS